MESENRKLIDRYLQNSLSGLELKNFMDRMEVDREFKNQVSLQNNIIEGIRQAEDSRLRESIEKRINYKKPLIPSALKLIIFFFIVAGAGITIWNFSGQESTDSKKKYLLFDIFRDKKPEIVKGNNIPENENEIKVTVPKSSKVLLDSPNRDIPEDAAQKDTGLNNQENPDIVVKKDQLLISIVMKAKTEGEDKQRQNNSDYSIAQNTAEALNPQADLPDFNTPEKETYIIEFWVSPVNYKGYRFFGNRIVLFGIEEPDAVQLIKRNDKLLFKYGSDLFSLEHFDDFSPFIADPEKPSLLK